TNEDEVEAEAEFQRRNEGANCAGSDQRSEDDPGNRVPLWGASQSGHELEAASDRDGVPAVFADRRSQPDTSESALKAELYQQIGQLQVEVDWLKKKSGLSR